MVCKYTFFSVFGFVDMKVVDFQCVLQMSTKFRFSVDTIVDTETRASIGLQ